MRPPVTFTAADVGSLCESFRGDRGDPLLLFHCTHGMGHGLTTFRGHDLPRALADCDLLYDPYERHACYGGAFMENIMSATEPHHSGAGLASHATGSVHEVGSAHGTSGGDGAFKPLDPDDLLYPCSRQARRYRTACYMLQTSAILHFNDRDFAGAAKVCDGAPTLMRPWCYLSLGRDVSAEAGRDMDEAIELCALGNPKYRPWCYAGAVKDIAFVRGSEGDGLSFCRRVPGQAEKAGCYRGLGEQLMALAPAVDRRRAICAGAEEGFRDDCESGARVAKPAPRQSPQRGE